MNSEAIAYYKLTIQRAKSAVEIASLEIKPDGTPYKRNEVSNNRSCINGLLGLLYKPRGITEFSDTDVKLWSIQQCRAFLQERQIQVDKNTPIEDLKKAISTEREKPAHYIIDTTDNAKYATAAICSFLSEKRGFVVDLDASNYSDEIYSGLSWIDAITNHGLRMVVHEMVKINRLIEK